MSASPRETILPDPMVPVPHRVRRMLRETHDIFTLELEPVAASGPLSFLAGQFNMLYAFGIGEVAISISGDPDGMKSWIHTVRAVGSVTQAICKLKRGDVIGVRGPFGSPWPVAEAVNKDVLIIAGGVGFAPLRPVVYQVLTQRERYRSVALLYGTRSPQDMLYREELKRWTKRFNLHLEVTVDTATSDWPGHVGVVTTLIGRAPIEPANSLALVCGPEVMMRFSIRELQQRGLKTDQIYLSMERNMKCAIGFCGHCQYGPMFVCKDGPVFRYDRVESLFGLKEI